MRNDRAYATVATARLAGVLYLMTISAGVFAEVFVRARLTVRGDSARTAANIVDHPMLYRAGEVADLGMLCCYVAVTALLYRLLMPGGRSLSLTAAAFSITGISVLAGSGMLHMAPLALLDGSGGPVLSLGQRDELIALALDLHGDVYAISLVFFGTYCILIGWLAIRGALLPRVVGALMIVGGLCHVVTKTMAILSPDLAHLLPRAMNVAPLIGELALALWLIAFGIRDDQRSIRPLA